MERLGQEEDENADISAFDSESFEDEQSELSRENTVKRLSKQRQKVGKRKLDSLLDEYMQENHLMQLNGKDKWLKDSLAKAIMRFANYARNSPQPRMQEFKRSGHWKVFYKELSAARVKCLQTEFSQVYMTLQLGGEGLLKINDILQNKKSPKKNRLKSSEKVAFIEMYSETDKSEMIKRAFQGRGPTFYQLIARIDQEMKDDPLLNELVIRSSVSHIPSKFVDINQANREILKAGSPEEVLQIIRVCKSQKLCQLSEFDMVLTGILKGMIGGDRADIVNCLSSEHKELFIEMCEQHVAMLPPELLQPLVLALTQNYGEEIEHKLVKVFKNQGHIMEDALTFGLGCNRGLSKAICHNSSNLLSAEVIHTLRSKALDEESHAIIKNIRDLDKNVDKVRCFLQLIEHDQTKKILTAIIQFNGPQSYSEFHSVFQLLFHLQEMNKLRISETQVQSFQNLESVKSVLQSAQHSASSDSDFRISEYVRGKIKEFLNGQKPCEVVPPELKDVSSTFAADTKQNLHYWQSIIVEELLNQCQTVTPVRTLVNVPSGMGKSLIISVLASTLYRISKKPVYVVASNKYLQTQIFEKHILNSDKIYFDEHVFRLNPYASFNKVVVMTMAQLLVNDIKEDCWVLVDECDQELLEQVAAVAEYQGKKILMSKLHRILNHPKVIGFTGTLTQQEVNNINIVLDQDKFVRFLDTSGIKKFDRRIELCKVVNYGNKNDKIAAIRKIAEDESKARNVIIIDSNYKEEDDKITLNLHNDTVQFLGLGPFENFSYMNVAGSLREFEKSAKKMVMTTNEIVCRGVDTKCQREVAIVIAFSPKSLSELYQAIARGSRKSEAKVRVFIVQSNNSPLSSNASAYLSSVEEYFITRREDILFRLRLTKSLHGKKIKSDDKINELLAILNEQPLTKMDGEGKEVKFEIEPTYALKNWDIVNKSLKDVLKSMKVEFNM